MKVNDLLVFIGLNKEDSHFKNFEYGKTYKIKSIESLPDSDLYGAHLAVLFEGSNYGCLSCYLNDYFIPLENFRNNNINKIINGRNPL